MVNDLNDVNKKHKQQHSFLFELLVSTPSEAISLVKQSLADKHASPLPLLAKICKDDLTGKKLLWKDLFLVFAQFQPLLTYLNVLLLFLYFVYANRGIVVGDRDNHQPSLHLVQIFYYATFVALFSFSSYLLSWKKLKNLLNFLRTNLKLHLLFSLPLIGLIVHNFTYEHSFIVSDNRHFTFYLWSKLFKRHDYLKYAYSYIYLVSLYLIYRNLSHYNNEKKTVGWLLLYAGCTSLCIVPQRLIEFRYFIIPFLIYRLNINQTTLKEILIEILFNTAVNYVTIYLFLNKTFVWPQQPDEVQRFMW